jgi:hypothetical protein
MLSVKDSYPIVAVTGSTMAEHLTHNVKIVGSNPAADPGKRKSLQMNTLTSHIYPQRL